jgi:hypothetical protein
MNTLKNFYLVLILAFSVTLVSCDDDDDGGGATSKMDMLTAGIWTGNQALEDGQDVSAIWRDGGWDIKKYSLNFSENGTYTYTYEGNEQQGTWRFTRDEQYVKFNNAEEAQLSTLNENKLNLIYDMNGVSQELRFVR